MPAEATITAPIQTEAVIPPVAAAPVLLGMEAPALTVDQAAATAAAAAAAAPAAAAAAQTPEAIAAKAVADAKTAADAKAALGAPEKYEFKAPEGKPEYDSHLLEAFEAGAREANLPQDAAQKLLDSMSPKIAERQLEQVTAVRKEWADASRIDTEFGGDKLDVNLATAKKTLDTFGSPDLNKLLVSTGLGNHPEVIRLMFKVGQAISEDKFVAGSASASKPSATAVLYDNTTSK